jgi:hypothetical protein
MKTTLHLDDRVAAAAKRHAESQGTTLTAVINSALRQYLASSRRPKQKFKLELQSRKTGPLPGVDLEDRASLYDLMDEG